ncbi:MAG: hypothetical protein K2Y71_22300 [Xanthobacteraceae bacterium]|nr:hypothetical protein [Xanthobacteraceae bacterium]
MEEFDPEDDERPIESYPGFIGVTLDDEFFPEKELECLKSLNWERYTNLLEWAPDDHTIEVEFRKGLRRINRTYDYSSLCWLLDQVPSIKVFHDPGGPSIASAAVFIFFIADGVSAEELEHDVLALLAALQSDFQALEAQHGQELDEIIGTHNQGRKAEQ